MKRFVTQPHTLKFRYFLVTISFCMLTLYGTYAKATTIIHEGVTAIKLTSATLGANITPQESIVLDRGIFWSTTPGVTSSDHKVPEGGVAAGSFTVDVTGLDRSATIYFKGYYTDNAGTFLSDESSFSNVPVFVGTGNWDDAANWNVQEVPGYDEEDSPIIDGNCTIANNSTNGYWICEDLTINVGATLIINTDRVLQVAGTLINNANESGLIIKSDAIHPNGTLTFQQGTPLATVEMYSKASWDLNQADGSKYSWQFFGLPVKTFIMTNAFSNCIIRKYNETSSTDANLWINQNALSTLNSGIGYEIVQQDSKIYEFAGELTKDDFTRTVDYTPGTIFPGQHIFANPYTAAIDIKSIAFDPNTEKSVYLYNTGTYNQWLDNGSTVYDGSTSAPGQYTVSTPNTAGVFGVPAQIPSMQGFLVKTLSQTSGSITIPYVGGIVNNTEQQRSPGKSKVAAAEKTVTRIDLSGKINADRMWIFSDPSCTSDFDNGWDGYKIPGAVQTPQLYAMETEGDLQIDAVADINGTYLGFKAGSETDYRLTFTHKNTESLYNNLYLVDLIENKTIDITSNGSEYAFKAVSTPAPVKRFKIVTSPDVSTSNQQISSKVKVFSSNGTVFVQNRSDQNGSVILYNMNGVAVKRMEFKANDIATFSALNLLPGAYVIKACANQDMVTERIIIR